MSKKKKNGSVSFSLSKAARGCRGATMVEYALLLVAVVLMAAAAFKNLGPMIGVAATNTAKQF